MLSLAKPNSDNNPKFISFHYLSARVEVIDKDFDFFNKKMCMDVADKEEKKI